MLPYVSTRYWKILRLLYSDLHKSHASSIARYGYHTPSFWSTCPRSSWEMKYSLRTFENILLFAFLFYIAIISGVQRSGDARGDCLIGWPLPNSSIEQWWQLLLDIRCFWRHNMTSYSGWQPTFWRSLLTQHVYLATPEQR